MKANEANKIIAEYDDNDYLVKYFELKEKYDKTKNDVVWA